MGITKKISPIKKAYPKDFHTLESSLSDAGFHRFPGTKRTFLPSREGGKYRTGLDEKALYLQKLPEEERKAEIERIQEDRARLEQQTGLDLSPNSLYYNFGANIPDDQKVTPVKIGTQDKFFNLSDPYQEITWNWIRVHANIAPSLDAVRRGDVHPDVVQYYVADDEAEMKTVYLKKQALNKAIQVLERLTPTRRRQVARLLGLPIADNTKDEQVYNLIDNSLKEGEFTSGLHRGLNAVSLFTDLVNLKEERLKIKDMVRQAIALSLFRVRGNGKVYEGENELAASETDLVDLLLKDKKDSQELLFALEKKLSQTKLQEL